MNPDPINTSPGDAAILRELDSVHDDIREEREAVRDDLQANRKEVKEVLAEFRTEVNLKLDAVIAEQKITNGRVRKLEIVAAVVRAGVALFVLLTPFVIYFLTSQ